MVSVVVPVYNAEPYLDRCLTSLLDQTLRPIEILCVDNGSVDGSGAVLERFAAKDPRIVPVGSAVRTQGAGHARNVGIQLAKGEYISFVDADDCVDPDFLERLYNAAVGCGADMACAQVMRVEGGVATLFRHNPRPKQPISILLFEKIEFIRNLTVCSKIFKTSFLDKNAIRFEENLFSEDILFNVHSSFHANKIIFVDGTFYHYIQNPSSITQRSEFMEKLALDMLSVANSMLRLADDYGFSDAEKAEIRNIILDKMIVPQAFISRSYYDSWVSLLGPEKKLVSVRRRAVRKWLFSCSIQKKRLVLCGKTIWCRPR